MSHPPKGHVEVSVPRLPIHHLLSGSMPWMEVSGQGRVIGRTATSLDS